MNLSKKQSDDPFSEQYTKRSNHKIPGYVVPITPDHSLATSSVDPLLIECTINKEGIVYTNWIGLNAFRGYTTNLDFCGKAIEALKRFLCIRYGMQPGQFVGLSDYRPDGTTAVSVKSRVPVPRAHFGPGKQPMMLETKQEQMVYEVPQPVKKPVKTEPARGRPLTKADRNIDEGVIDI